MSQLRMHQVAELVGMSTDTVRRWVDIGRLRAGRDEQGHRVVLGADLAAFVRADASEGSDRHVSSARNHFKGIVTNVVSDAVMAKVEIHAGPHRLVSLMSREAVDDLGLEVGTLATAVVKATNVVVETRAL